MQRYRSPDKLSCSEAGKLGAIASKETHNTKRLKRIEKYQENPDTCVQCGTEIEYDRRGNKFCNKSCSATYNNIQHPKRCRIKKYCLWCGSEVQKIFCNRQCQWDYHSHIKLNAWFIFNTFSEGDKYFKNWILDKQGGVCNHCSIPPFWNGKDLSFELEHIDGNSTNNKRSNLEVLCPNCHSQTPTYKGKNKGKGRHKRRERYREGKSF